MRQPVILAFCDNCLVEKGVKVAAGYSGSLTLDGAESEIDLCDVCDAALLAPVRKLQAAIGHRTTYAAAAEDTSRTTTLTRCPLCGNWMDVRNRAKHVKDKHADSAAGELDWRYNDTVKEVWLCDCGLTFPSKVGRGMHARKSDHGLPVPDEAQEPLYASS
jgi:hypothetical protein